MIAFRLTHLYSLSLIYLLFFSFPSGSRAQTLIEGFADTEHLTGFTGLAGITFDKNGNMYAWEKRGRLYSINASLQKNLVINIDEEVGNWRDFGMLGVALDPNYLQNGFIYLYYVVDRHHLLHFGKPTYNANADDYFNATIGRITRYRVNNPANPSNAKAALGSRRVLLGETKETGIIIIHQSHGTGQLVFGTDGSLIASVGDGASYQGVDEGSQSTTYWQQALADGIMDNDENIGAYRSQVDLSLNGKILRLNPNSGDGLPSNPLYDPNNPRSPQSRLWSRGFRNPFRFCLRPNTGSHVQSKGDPGVFYVGDVGWNKAEELNIVEIGDENFGWPKYEGMTHEPGYNKNAYRPNDHKLAALEWRTKTPRATVNGQIYDVGSNQVPGESFVGNSSTGGVWYTGNDFPSMYRNTYFHADYGGKWIKNIVFNANNDPVEVREFASDLGAVVFLASHPTDGGLYYIPYDKNTIRQISFSASGNQPPIANIFADKTYGASPLTVNFHAFQSYDPEGKNMRYRWRFGDGNTSNSESPSHTFTSNGIETFTTELTITDSEGLKDTEEILIHLNNTPPQIIATTIDNIDEYPLDRPLTLNLDAQATDVEHGNELDYSWQTFLYHNDHNHPEVPVDKKVAQTEISPIGCDGETYWYRIVLTVTDPAGLSASYEKDIYPDCPGREQSITFNSIDNKLTTDGSFDVSASASSNLPVTFYIASGPATIDGNRVTLLGTPGEVVVRATQAGDNQYDQAIPVEQSFGVYPPGSFQNQTITFDPIGEKLTTESPYQLVATASSGLPVSFELVSGPATLNGSQLTFTGQGRVKVQANQKGNTIFNPAPSVEQAFDVIDPTIPPTLTLSYPTDGEVVYGSNFTATYSMSGYLRAVKYLRYTLDDRAAIIIDAGEETFDLADVEAGRHILTVELLDEDQRPFNANESKDEVEFGLSCDTEKGLIYRKYYRGIPGNKISRLTDDESFPNDPTGQDQLTKFQGPANFGNNYGTWVEGFLYPSSTGKHRFYIAGDNHVELYLSSNDDPANKQLIANIEGSTREGQLDKYESQISEQFDLEQGERYYIELLHKEGRNNDHFAVYWTTPEFDEPRIIDSDFLSPYFYCIDNREFQSINFDPIEDKPSNAPEFTISAKSTSGLPVSFSVLSGPAIVEGDKVTLTGGIGIVTIKAEQQGDFDYHAAPEVLQSFEVYDHTIPTALLIDSPSEGEILYAPDPVITFSRSGYLGKVGFIEIQLNDGKATIIDGAEEWYAYENMAPGTYAVTARLLDKDAKPLPNPEAQASVNFIISCDAPTGNILVERWWNIEGWAIQDLTTHPNYPENPDETLFFDSFRSPKDLGNKYGTRVRGYIHAPSDGFYTFAVAGDDQVDLFLSVNESPETQTRIANLEEYTGRNQLNKFPSQQSEPIELKGGRKYYVELLQKESYGGDHFSVFWKTPNGRDDFVRIDGEFLSPWIECGESQTGLSLEFLDFKATYVEGQVDLNWSTAYEFNNEYFTIERSSDGEDFEEIGNMVSQGNSAVPQFYEAVDPETFKGRIVYRIKQTNFDKDFSYSPQEVIYILTGGVEVFPNPAIIEEAITIEVFDEGVETIETRLTSITGQTVFQQTLELDPNTQETELDVPFLTKGMYILSISTGNATYKKKIQVEE